jgi:bifunctional non-homologous end joining protein LigD
MGLQRYHQKRDFKKTPEPRGTVRHDHNHLFVIQKHAASHLHYDFRIELHGVLKSWAVPKGPCLDPSVKRLAVHVEDHPIEYGSFEGIIPAGEYGGGTVMLWDEGIWIPLDDDPQKAYEKGHLRFELRARKLQGRWDLIQFKKEEKSWFLIKYDDEYAKPFHHYDITIQEPNSVKTEQSIEDIAKNYENVWGRRGLEKANRKSRKEILEQLLPSDLKESSFPKKVSPELATLVDKAPGGSEWLHEIKLDGYRIIAFKEGNSVRLLSRNHIDWTAHFANVVRALKTLPFKRLILDGEIVLLDEFHHSNFQLLQNSMKADKDYAFIYYVFDLLYYEKYNLKKLSLLERKKLLKALCQDCHETIRYSDHIIDNGVDVFAKACDLGLEGIISKHIHSHYQEKRSKSWVKVKCSKRQEFVIGGYTKPQGSRQYFRSLFLGVFNEEGEFVYCGNVGTGFTESALKSLFNALQKYISEDMPFKVKPRDSKGAVWVKPKLVVEIEFSEWTSEGKLRHPSFKGLREDKKASLIKKEKEMPVSKIEMKGKPEEKPKSQLITLTNPKKILYKEDKITKEHLLNYYNEISDYILPYLINRPLTLVRCPTSYEDCFYQKHYYKATPKQLLSIPIKNQTDDEMEDYIYLKDKEGLLSLVQMGVLEIHPWGSKIDHIEYPDMITIDLDPGPDVIWKKIVEAAFAMKHHFEEIKLKSFVKTTGGKGLHVVIPIKPEYDWGEVKHFANVFVEVLEKMMPERYVTNMAKSKRKGKIFIDYLRNQRGATAISAYSLRARLHAPVSTPLRWDELTDHVEDTFYTIHTLPSRMKALQADPWQGFWNLNQALQLNKW